MSANTNPPTPPLDGQEEIVFINKYLNIEPGGTMHPSIKYYAESGHVSGTLFLVMKRMMNEYAQQQVTAALTQANDRVKELEAKLADRDEALIYMLSKTRSSVFGLFAEGNFSPDKLRDIQKLLNP